VIAKSLTPANSCLARPSRPCRCRSEARSTEDALQAAAAERCRADCIITGNSPDFSASSIPALSPDDYIAAHAKIHSGNGPPLGDSQIREKFDRILARVPDAPPQPGDERTD
jgi:hypothetical protein